MRSLILFMAIIVSQSFNDFARADLRFKNCSMAREALLAYASIEALANVVVIQTQIRERLLQKRDSKDVAAKLESAHKKLSCVYRKLPNMTYKCLNREHRWAAARTLPLVGDTVSLFDIAFAYPRYLAGYLAHEAAHKCGANDRVYYNDDWSHPDDDVANRWDKTAAIYEWWVNFGFCVPGEC